MKLKRSDYTPCEVIFFSRNNKSVSLNVISFINVVTVSILFRLPRRGFLLVWGFFLKYKGKFLGRHICSVTSDLSGVIPRAQNIITPCCDQICPNE